MQAFDLKSSSGFENLQIVVNSLYKIRNKASVNNKVEFDVLNLDLKKTYSALNELIGSFVDVLMDEKGALFSQNLSKEADACKICVKKIQHLVESKLNRNLKPIIVVSKRNESVIIVAILTSQFQSCDSSKNYPILYSIEPSTGKRDLLGSTEHKLFEIYLTKGSKENGIGKIFEPNVQLASDTSNSDVCKNVEGNDAWLCIYYSLLLIYEGSDTFLGNNLAWLDIDISAVKTILIAYLPSLAAAETQNREKKIAKKKCTLNKLNNVEQDLTELFNERKRHLESKINLIKDSSIDQQINRLVNDELRLKNANKKLINEIAQIEHIIKQSESLLLSGKNDNTTKQRFQNFITGQEKKSLELKIGKKIEKSKQDILIYNESERTKIFELQVNKLEQDLNLVQNNIQQIKNSIVQLDKNIGDQNNSIQEQNSQLKTLANKLDQLNSQMESNKLEENRLKTIQSEINQINVDNQYGNLINYLLRDDIKSDKNYVESLRKNLDENAAFIKYAESSLETLKISIESNNSKVSQLRVLIDSRNTSISSLESDLREANSRLSDLNDEYDSHNNWYSSWWYASKRDEISKEISNQKNYINELKNKIASYETDVRNYTNEINSLEADTNKNRHDQASKQKDLNRTNDYQRQVINSLKSLKDQLVCNLMDMIKQKEKIKLDLNMAIGINQKSQSEANESISRSNKELKHLNKQVETQTFSLQIAQCTQDEIIKKIDQTKLKQKNTDIIQKVLVEPVKHSKKDQVFNNTLIESKIISDEQFKCLMNNEFESMQINGKFQNWKLLYRGSRDGFEACSFHKKCDTHPNTLTIVRTDTLKIFGGFTGSTWSSDSNEFKSDPYAFLFSLATNSNNSQIIKCSDEKYAIYCDKDFGPCFGNGDIKINNLSNLSKKNESTVGFTYGEKTFEYGSIESKTALAGSQFFCIDEIEVFCKHFNPLTQNEIDNYIPLTKKSKKTILQAYETFHTIAVNGMISLNSFIAYLVNKIKVFRNIEELDEMKNLFTFIFHQFDEDNSGLLEFNEFITCFCIFDTRKKSEIASLFLEKKRYLKFFFDYADKDKSQTLELHELNHLLDQFPLIFKNNPQIQNLSQCLLHKKDQSLTKDEFLSLLDENKKIDINLDKTQLLDSSLIDSVIMNNCEEFNNLMKLNKFENQKWKLIYRASRDGFGAKDFHLKCDGKFNTLTLIKTTKGDILGGYATTVWSSINEYLTDQNSFIFILKNKQNNFILIPDVGLLNSPKLGPCFGSDYIKISNKSNLNSRSKLNIDSSNINNFRVENIEVFRKDYTDLNQLIEEIEFFKTQHQLPESELNILFYNFQSMAINGLLNIDQLIEFLDVKSKSGEDFDTQDIEFLKKIFLYFDEEKTGVFKFVDFMKIISMFNTENGSFFKLLFDIADKDKSNSLDEEEIREIFGSMPSNILNNENALEYARQMNKPKLPFLSEPKWLSKDKFVDLIRKKNQIYPNIPDKYFFGKITKNQNLRDQNNDNLEFFGNVYENLENGEWQINVSKSSDHQTFTFKDEFVVMSIENFDNFEWISTRLRNIPDNAFILDTLNSDEFYLGKIGSDSEIPAIFKDNYWQHFDEERVPELFEKIDPKFSRIKKKKNKKLIREKKESNIFNFVCICLDNKNNVSNAFLSYKLDNTFSFHQNEFFSTVEELFQTHRPHYLIQCLLQVHLMHLFHFSDVVNTMHFSSMLPFFCSIQLMTNCLVKTIPLIGRNHIRVTCVDSRELVVLGRPRAYPSYQPVLFFPHS
ncbi:tldc domain-containing [Brachionus plicatilis]|uniref:Tldc domain-containing n=1 Tax=Brachionus plicatilis TaxID=10195 RepID=A0A3M7T9B4_BRAPC|nr:tldc domain-containing [Brachionus plicatilis]